MLARDNKIASAEQVAARIADGSTIAVGGLSYFGAPMSLLRALVRRRARHLTVITAAVASLQADFLIAAECVSRLISPYVSLEELGLAPNFRRAVERGQIELLEIGEAFLGCALKAGAAGAPYYAMPLPLAASDCARVNACYKIAADPFTGNQVVCVPALRPDWALLHAQSADGDGTLHYHSASFMDGLLARAAAKVLATADELAETSSRTAGVTIPGFLVEAVVPLYGAARPTASFGRYSVDRGEISRYARASRSPEGLAANLAELGSEEQSYLQRLGSPPELEPKPESNPDLRAPASLGEIMATVMCHSVRDGMFTGAGTGCWEVAAGLRLAQLTHAPNLSFTWGGSGAWNAELDWLPASLNGDEALAFSRAQISLEDILDFEMRGRFDVMFASAMQVDRYGNLNLAAIGPQDHPRLRGPGSVGLEFAPCAGELVIFLRNHSRQSLVEKVDFISGIGYGTGPGSRTQWGLDDQRGPRLVISNLAVMDFDPASLHMRLRSLHPGITLEQVRENTGFDLLIPAEVPPTPLPSEEELRLLRTRIDRQSLLRRLP